MLSLGRNDAEGFIFSFVVSLRKGCHTFVHCSRLIFAPILWLAENRHVIFPNQIEEGVSEPLRFHRRVMQGLIALW